MPIHFSGALANLISIYPDVENKILFAELSIILLDVIKDCPEFNFNRDADELFYQQLDDYDKAVESKEYKLVKNALKKTKINNNFEKFKSYTNNTDGYFELWCRIYVESQNLQ